MKTIKVEQMRFQHKNSRPYLDLNPKLCSNGSRALISNTVLVLVHAVKKGGQCPGAPQED